MQLGPRDRGGPPCVVDGAFEGAGGETDSTVKEGVGVGGTEGGRRGKVKFCVMFHVVLLGGSMILAPHIVLCPCSTHAL